MQNTPRQNEVLARRLRIESPPFRRIYIPYAKRMHVHAKTVSARKVKTILQIQIPAIFCSFQKSERFHFHVEIRKQQKRKHRIFGEYSCQWRANVFGVWMEEDERGEKTGAAVLAQFSVFCKFKKYALQSREFVIGA